MTVSLTLSPEKETRLRERAAAAGQEFSVYVSRLLEQFVEPPTPPEETRHPVYQQFLDSGMTDDELGEMLEMARHQMRAERRAHGEQ